MQAEEARQRMIESILSGNRDQANEVFDGWTQRFGCQRAIAEVLDPVLLELGNLWSQEKISLAAGYLAGKVAEDVLFRALEREESLPETKGPVVIGNVEDDYHSMGRKLVGIFLKTAGWGVIDLGNDVAAAAFVDEAVKNGVRVIGVSAMMLTTAENIKKVREEIDGRGLTGRIRLAVGGAVFKIRPELTAEVGGDGTCANAIDAPRLFERLWAEGDSHDIV